jgi:hypothetical protein
LLLILLWLAWARPRPWSCGRRLATCWFHCTTPWPWCHQFIRKIIFQVKHIHVGKLVWINKNIQSSPMITILKCYIFTHKNCETANFQWKHAGPISQRHVDRNHALLQVSSYSSLYRHFYVQKVCCSISGSVVLTMLPRWDG